MFRFRNIKLNVVNIMEDQIKFYSNVNFQGDGLIKVDVLGENLPENLFGVSFHLLIEGPEWQLVSYDPGYVFFGTEPLVMVQEKHDQSNEIVFGMSMKRDDEYSVNDGSLTTFFIAPKDSGSFKMTFENPIAVGFDKGRIDFNNIEWAGTEFEVNTTNQTKMVLNPVEDDEEPVADFSYSSSVLQDGRADIMKITKDSQHSIWDVYVVLFVSFFILTFGYMAYLWFIGRRNNS